MLSDMIFKSIFYFRIFIPKNIINFYKRRCHLQIYYTRYISLLLGQFLLVGCICANVVIRVIYVRMLYPTRYYYYYLCMYAGQSSESARIVQNMLVERLTMKFLVFKVNWNYKLIQIFERQKSKIDPASYIK